MNKQLNIKRGGAFALAVILCVMALLLAFITPQARAQSPIFAPNAVAIPITIAAATTTNLATPLLIDASKQRNVGFTFSTSWSTSGEATGNTNLLFTLAPTVDGTRMDTNKTVTLAAYNYTSAGNTSTSSTNLDATGYKGWFIIKIVNNSAAGVATNGTGAFTYSTKIGAP